jgi:hypothetical protein
MSVLPNHFIGTSLNEIAISIDEDQTMWVNSFPGQTMPTDVVTYPCFEPGIITNGTVIFIPTERGYYRVKVLRR